MFQAQFGFFDTVVAAPSRAAALRAWGTRQNLFASGEATVTTDEAAIAAAIAYPEVPLRRAVGSSDPFALEPASLPKVPDAPKRALAKASGKAPAKAAKVAPREPPAPPADRSALNAAEATLGRIDEQRKREEARFRREAEDFEHRRMAAQEAYVAARKAATAKIVAARTAYRAACGRD